MGKQNNILGITLLTGASFAVGMLCRTSLDTQAIAAPMQDHDHSHDHAHQDHSHGDMPMNDAMTTQMMAMEEAGRVTEHHKQLEVMEGKFTGQYRMWFTPDAPPMEFETTVEREWVLDGRFLNETVTSETPGGPFNGVAYIGYDNMEGRYVMVWMDNHSTAIWTMHGSMDPNEGIFRAFGTSRDPLTGHIVTSWGETDLSNADYHTSVGWAVDADGEVYKQFEMTMRRAK